MTERRTKLFLTPFDVLCNIATNATATTVTAQRSTTATSASAENMLPTIWLQQIKHIALHIFLRLHYKLLNLDTFFVFG